MRYSILYEFYPSFMDMFSISETLSRKSIGYSLNVIYENEEVIT